MVGAQLVMLPFDPKDHVATSTALTFQLGGVAYLLGFIALLLFAVASHEWLEAGAGRLGVAVPWLGEKVPSAFDTTPTILFALGALASYLLFALAWVLYGIASLRAHAPVAMSVAIAVAGALGHQALLSPWGVPRGLAVGAGRLADPDEGGGRPAGDSRPQPATDGLLGRPSDTGSGPRRRASPVLVRDPKHSSVRTHGSRVLKPRDGTESPHATPRRPGHATRHTGWS